MIGKATFLSGRYGALALLLFFLATGAGQAAEPAAAGSQALLSRYASIKPKLEKNQFGAPIYLESVESHGAVRVDMYGVFNYPFEEMKEALQSPANWCDIAPLHINIKACTYRKGSQSQLTLYSGRKYYQSPADTYPLKLRFRVLSQQPAYLNLALDADEGPLRTRNHNIGLEAAPLDGRSTFLHFSYSYTHGPVARMAIKSYFATLGRDKIGFTLVRGREGKQFYIEGVRGAIERNTVRYYLALQTYLDTLRLPEGQRFEQRLSRWYDLTARYPRQLKELDKPEYLTNKRQERANQVSWQKNEGS